MATNGQIVEIPATSPLYKGELPEFSSKAEMLSWHSQSRPYSLFDGFLVGGHSGVENFKLGQRRGINVGGKKQALYVIQIDEENNRLFVGAGENHPGLWTNVISIDAKLVRWKEEDLFSTNDLENGVPVEIKSSVVQGKIPALFYIFKEDGYLEFEKPTLIIIKEHPIHLYYDNNLLSNIN